MAGREFSRKLRRLWHSDPDAAPGACARRRPKVDGSGFAPNLAQRPRSITRSQAGIVRFVGTSGQVDFVIPPHSSVMINPPTTIGVVTGYLLFFDHCSTGVHSFSGPEPWQQGTSFAFLESGDNGNATSVTFGNLGTPPPGISEVAATTTACENVTPR